MDTLSLQNQFARIGARLKVTGPPRPRPGRPLRAEGPVVLDVRDDRRGEYFEVAVRPEAHASVEAVDVRPAERHLLLLVREGQAKHKFLCGHDERHWFVAAVPEAAAGVGGVRAAREALKPAEVRAAQERDRLKPSEAARRRNSAFVRQGEWFFVPEPGLVVNGRLVLRDEPLSRGAGGKPHRVEFCYRSGGETVYVCRRHPAGLTEASYRALLSRRPEAKEWPWSVLRRGMAVYARGRVRHADHATVTLPGWHRVLMNTENQARAMRHVAFLD